MFDKLYEIVYFESRCMQVVSSLLRIESRKLQNIQQYNIHEHQFHELETIIKDMFEQRRLWYQQNEKYEHEKL
jgi:hypothetical protein